MYCDDSSSSSSFDDEWSSCSSCSSDTEAQRELAKERHRTAVAAHQLLAKRAKQARLRQKAKAVMTAINAVMQTSHSPPPTDASTSASPDTARIPTAGLSSRQDASVLDGLTSAASGHVAADSRVSGDSALPPGSPGVSMEHGNATPPLRSSTSRRGSMRRRSSGQGLQRRGSIHSVAGSILEQESDHEAEAAASEAEAAPEMWQPDAAQEMQITVATVLKKGTRSRNAVELELATKALRSQRPVVKVEPLEPLTAILKQYHDRGAAGKSVTQFGAAGTAVLFIVKMKRLRPGKTQHELNQERLAGIQSMRTKKNDALRKRIAGATTRSMHLHIQKQRSGLRNIVHFAVQESNDRTRQARHGKVPKERGALMRHTEDRLFDRSEFSRGEIGSRGTGGPGTATDQSAMFASGDFARGDFTELSQFLFDRDHAGSGAQSARPPGTATSAIVPASGSGALGSASDVAGDERPQTDASNANVADSGGLLNVPTLLGESAVRPAVSPPAGAANRSARFAAGGTASSGAVTSRPGHRALQHPVQDANLFVLHHKWRDEPFRDPYVETERVYQYATQRQESELFKFTRTRLPNLHLEIHRLKSQLDPTPWQGSGADHRHRAEVAKREEQLRQRKVVAQQRRNERSTTVTPQTARSTTLNLSRGENRQATGRSAATSRGAPRSDTMIPQPPSRGAASSARAPPSRSQSFRELPPIAASAGVSAAFGSRRQSEASVADSMGRSEGALPTIPATTTTTPRASVGAQRARTMSLAEIQRMHESPGGDLSNPPGSASMTGLSKSAAEQAREDRMRRAALDEDARAQRRAELAMLQHVMEAEHRAAIETFHRFLLHKEMEHSVFSSRSIDEVRRLIESNDLIFPMKRREILRGPAGSARRTRVTGRALDRKVAERVKSESKGAASYDALRDLREAEEHVKRSVKQHQHERSVAYTKAWFTNVRTLVELHMGGLPPRVASILNAFEPLFEDRITGPEPFKAKMKEVLEDDEATLLDGNVQFVLMRLAVPFRVSLEDVRQFYAQHHLPFLLLDTQFYRALKEEQEIDQRSRVRAKRMGDIGSMEKVNARIEQAIEMGAARAENSARGKRATIARRHESGVELVEPEPGNSPGEPPSPLGHTQMGRQWRSPSSKASPRMQRTTSVIAAS